MLSLRGAPALSSFRRAKLLEKLQLIAPRLRAVAVGSPDIAGIDEGQLLSGDAGLL